MKLLSLTSRYNFAAIILILIIGGFVSYYILKNIINHEFNEKLFADKEQFLFEWHNFDNLQDVFYLNVGDRIKIDSIEQGIFIPTVLSDTLMWDNYENRILPFRTLSFSDQLNQVNYKIVITKSLLPTEDLITGIGEIMLLLTIFLIIALSFVTRQISKKLWAPFYYTISKLEKYEITQDAEVFFDQVKIYEFNELNRVIMSMIIKSKNDYKNLKEFTENASHEIQTPLAIIKSRAENLLQDSRLDQGQIEDISKIYDATTRLSKLKNGLSMLSKMENNQFNEVEPIQIVPFIEKTLSYFMELIKLKKIKINKTFRNKPTLILNNTLTYILINNLISNAIKHNIQGGFLQITVDVDFIIFENSGNTLEHSPENYFRRFKKDSNAMDSSGLGLALIKKICDIYHIEIKYSNPGNLHRIELKF
ncbi:HAMP domain-containing histidine kinase [Reichenbachiella agarivorans]|uniref:histidine kinase n=1 Tax=Reichenbachiella agarivorans TaxID=2979464 RepID=A0ABY6CUF3_9BACT|nr:HAMP domain-containing sensor histidine kinase [Reichenbachiella agarivorans]UXP33964.1 HAMP domain-containing histidine kinase [Reichenbachiella agarivorans]